VPSGSSRGSPLSTHASRTSSPGVRLVRNLDLVVLALALPVFLLAGLSLAGYAAMAVIWLAQRALGVVLQGRADASDDPRTVVGLLAGGSMARAWLTALAILATGLVDERAGLAAVLLALVLFTTHFATRLLERGIAP
jgi:hypothetical protein